MEEPLVYPFHLGIVAAAGFEVPDLARKLRPRLRTLLDRRLRRREPVSVTGICSEPVSQAAREWAGEKGWGYGFVVRPPNRPLRAGHLAACGHVVAISDGLLLIHAEGVPLPADLADLGALAERMGVRVRAVGL